MMNTRLQNRLTETEILKIFSDTVEVSDLPTDSNSRADPQFCRPSLTCTTKTRH